MPTPEALKRTLNHYLFPTEVSIADVKYVPWNFYFKTDAKEKHYEYLIYSNLGDDHYHINFKSKPCYSWPFWIDVEKV